jgi:L-ribulose-5-phosphate 3-epimerase
VTGREMSSDGRSQLVAVGCTTVAYLKHPLTRALEGISSCGVRNVELASIPHYCDHLPPGHLPDAPSVSKLCADYGLRPVAVSAHGDLKVDSDVDHIADCMRFAADIGATIVNTGTGDAATSEDETRIVTAIEQLAAIGDRTGVTLGLETQNTIVTSGEEAVALIDRIGSERVRINLDPANIVYWSGHDALSECRRMAGYVAHMHVKDHRGGRGDYEFPPLGSGDLPLEQIIATLLDAGFDGTFVLEPEPSEPVATRPPAEVMRVQNCPGLAYSEFHSYLGESDPTRIDAEVCAGLDYLAGVVTSHGGG